MISSFQTATNGTVRESDQQYILCRNNDKQSLKLKLNIPSTYQYSCENVIAYRDSKFERCRLYSE
jgi:hypothetical protein